MRPTAVDTVAEIGEAAEIGGAAEIEEPPVVTVVVPLVARGQLAAADLAGRSLLLHALEAVAGLPGAQVVVVVDDVGDEAGDLMAGLPRGVAVRRASRWWAAVPRSGPLLVHDPLCPLTPSATIEAALAAVLDRPETAVAGFRPVTDTVKVVERDVIVGTVDREVLAIIASPLAIGAAAVGSMSHAPDLIDLAAAVENLRQRGPVELIAVPTTARRVDDEAALQLLRGVVAVTTP